MSLLASVQFAGAQSKAALDAIKNVDKAAIATMDAKKGTKSATWVKLAEAYVKAYDAPVTGVVPGMFRQEIQMLLSAEQLLSSEARVVSGQEYTVDVYADKALYYDGMGQLAIVEVTQPVYNDIDPLQKAIDAYLKAGEIETKEKGLEKIKEGLSNVASRYFEAGMNQYYLGNLQKASDIFVQSLKASENPIANKVDTLAIYNAAFTASQAGDTVRAVSMLKRCVEIGHYENGDVFASLGNLYSKSGDAASAKEVLEEGFKLFPQSQSILISLINYYMENEDNADRLFQLVAEAKTNEPNNASLYYVEGEVYKGLGNIEKALECYYKSFDIDNNYVFGLYSAGVLWYDEAVRVSDLAQMEMDDTKYMAMVEEFEGYMLNAIEPFEKLFASTEDAEFKRVAAEYLKSIYFRFRDRDPKYLEGFEKYNSYIASL